MKKEKKVKGNLYKITEGKSESYFVREKDAATGEESKREVFLHDDHSMSSRRDFLAAGLQTFSATVFAPTLLSVLLRSTPSVAASTCAVSDIDLSPMIPFIQLNLAGGAGLMANFVPRNAQGQVESDLRLAGLGSAALLNTPPTDVTGLSSRLVPAFGSSVPLWFYRSGFLRGLQRAAATAGLSPEVANYMNQTAMVGLTVQSRDDTNMNAARLVGLIQRAEAYGTKLPILSNTASFGAQPALGAAPSSPLSVQSILDLANAVDVASPIGGANGLSEVRKVGLFNLIARLSEREASRLLASNASEVRGVVADATEKNTCLAGQAKPPTSPLDPTFASSAQIQLIWGLNAASNPAGRDTVFAGIAANTIQGQAGPADLNIGGYDYHNGTRTAGDQRDEEAGLVVGRLLQTAAALKQKVFVVVTTDGSVQSPVSDLDTPPWTSDRGQFGGCLIFAYDPSGRPPLSAPNGMLREQIGFMGRGPSATQDFIPSWNVDRAMLAIFANYLRWSYRFRPGLSWSQAYQTIVAQAAAGVGLSAQLTTEQLDRVLRIGA